MTTKTDGGQAFPVPDMGVHGGYGMSLRDYFAAKALQGIIGGATGWRQCDYKPVDGLSIIENDARLAYMFADAMLKAREP